MVVFLRPLLGTVSQSFGLNWRDVFRGKSALCWNPWIAQHDATPESSLVRSFYQPCIRAGIQCAVRCSQKPGGTCICRIHIALLAEASIGKPTEQCRATACIEKIAVLCQQTSTQSLENDWTPCPKKQGGGQDHRCSSGRRTYHQGTVPRM